MKKITLALAAWLALITVAHAALNVDWRIVRERFLPLDKRKLNVAYIPVT